MTISLTNLETQQDKCCSFPSGLYISSSNLLQHRASCKEVHYVWYKSVSMRLLAEVVVCAIHQHQMAL